METRDTRQMYKLFILPITDNTSPPAVTVAPALLFRVLFNVVVVLFVFTVVACLVGTTGLPTVAAARPGLLSGLLTIQHPLDRVASVDFTLNYFG